MTDTTVRGFLYEGSGTVSPGILAGGSRAVAELTARHAIPARVIRADPADPARWLAEASGQLSALLSAGGRYPGTIT
jgi:hypothetical protein